jgi:hypothetical protein
LVRPAGFEPAAYGFEALFFKRAITNSCTVLVQTKLLVESKEKGAAIEVANPFFSLIFYGAEGQNRTTDTGIFNHHII